jgi:ceroid-lipofuscinosis MFS transporter 7
MQKQQQKPADFLSGDYPSQERRNESESNYVSMELAVLPVPENEDTDDDDDMSVDKTMVSSVMTADGVHDLPGFICVCFVILVGDMSRGVFFPSMWPLVKHLGGDQVTLGYSVAAFSFGRVLVNPLFGQWSVTYGYTKVLLLSCSILLFGTLLYAQIQNVGRPEFLIVAQTVLGIGSGTLGVTRAFVAEVTAKRQRTTYMAWITAVQYAGFTVTPFFGALFNHLLVYKDYKWGIFRLNMFTAPAYFMTLVIMGTLTILLYHFQDRHRIETTKDAKKSMKRAAVDEVSNTRTWIGLTIYDCCILGCMLLNVSTKGSIASFETLGVSIAQSHFQMMSARAGAIVAACGTVGVCALLSMGYLADKFTDIQLITGGMVVMAVGIASLTSLEEGVQNKSWRFMLSMFLIYSIGYPVGHTAVLGLFSKSK